MTQTQPRLGAHLSVAGGMHHALRAARRLRCASLQVFVKNQRQWRAPPLVAETVRAWHAELDHGDVYPVVAHASYLINLASADATLWAKSRAAMVDELTRCETLGIPYLVVHPGAAGEQSTDAAVARITDAIDRILKALPDGRTMILLETTAGQGTALGRSFAELGAIIAGVAEPQRVGVCVDTCHVFAAGYEIRDPAAYAAMIREAERQVGLHRIRCWHLNDSKGPLGSHRDRHEHIGRGQIGSAGFRNVLCDRRMAGLPMILETPKGVNERGREWDRVNLQRLRTIWTRGIRIS